MRCTFILAPITVLVTALTANAQDASSTDKDLEQVREQQKQLQQQVEKQQQTIDDLQKRLGTSGAPTSSDKDAMSWKEFSALGSKVKLYGFLRLDAYHDDSRPNNTQTIGWILSEDPSAPPGVGAGGRNREDFTMHPRLTRLGFDFVGPEVEFLGHPALTGKLEVDFFNNGLQGQTESREALRLRHGYLKLAWNDFSVLAGQTSDIISPIYPIVNADLVMWGAGNLGDRRPQLRGEFRPALGDGRLSLQAGVGLTGADDNQDLDATGNFGNGFRDGETSGEPTMQARLGYSTPMFQQTFDAGVWVHRGYEHPDTKLNGENQFVSRAVGADLTLPLVVDWLWTKGEIWRGANLDDVRGGIFQGINATTGRVISSRGGFGELGVKPISCGSFYAGYSIDDPETEDLNPGGRGVNRIWYLAGRFDFGALKLGVEYLHWRTGYVGFDEGVDNRLGAFIAYNF